jgi:hypothetical protein
MCLKHNKKSKHCNQPINTKAAQQNVVNCEHTRAIVKLENRFNCHPKNECII